MGPRKIKGLLDSFLAESEGLEWEIGDDPQPPRPKRDWPHFHASDAGPPDFLAQINRAKDRIIRGVEHWEQTNDTDRKQPWLTQDHIVNRVAEIALNMGIAKTADLKQWRDSQEKTLELMRKLQQQIEACPPHTLNALDRAEWESLDNVNYPETLEGRIVNQLGPLTALMHSLYAIELRLSDGLRVLQNEIQARPSGRGAPPDVAKTKVAIGLGKLYFDICGQIPPASASTEDGVSSFSGPFAPVVADVFEIFGWGYPTHYLLKAKEAVERQQANQE